MARGFPPPTGAPTRSATAAALGLGQGTEVDFADEALRALQREHGDGVRDVIRAENLGGIFGTASGEVGEDAAGADGADANAEGAEIFGHASRKTLKAPFRGAVERAASERIFPREGTDVDDVASAALNHERNDGTGDEKDAFEIGVENVVPIVFGLVLQGTETRIADSRVVDEKSDGTELFFGGLHEGGDVARTGDVGGLREDAIGDGAQGGGGGREGVGVASADGNGSAEAGEFSGDGFSDTTTSAGDQSDATGERFFYSDFGCIGHGNSPLP